MLEDTSLSSMGHILIYLCIRYLWPQPSDVQLTVYA